MGSFCKNYIKFQLQKYRRLISHDIEENLVNFHTSTQKSENFISMGYFCPKYMKFELKNTEELSFMTLKSDAKFE